MSVRDFMDCCLNDPEHGYYRTRPAIGRRGDFITAPEISQVFGELIGLWAAVVWRQMGAPARLNLIELGPGRGTMLADALRAAARMPEFLEAADVLLVEPSPALREVQEATLRHLPRPPRYIAHGEAPPASPSIVLTNEVLDCVPVVQWVRAGDEGKLPGWRERVVGLDEAGALQFGIGGQASPPADTDARPHNAPEGTILEHQDFREFLHPLLSAAARAPLCALFIDYGYDGGRPGDTLQAVRDHRSEHPLTSPGEADLTAHVDFADFALTVRRQADRSDLPVAVDGPLTQAEFLGRLGAVERASALMSANPADAARIEAEVARLLAPGGMGTRFKVIGLRSSGLPPLPGLEA